MKLIYPCEKYLNSYKEAYLEDLKYRAGEEEIFCPPDIVIAQAYNYRNGINMKEGYVESTMLWCIEDEEFIGCVDIRHRLTNNLLKYGGHIGYEIRYSKWNQGYGTMQLKLTLEYLRKHFNFEKVLITCNDDNIGSAKVIENNGGILENKIENITENNKKVLTRRYWITL